MACTACTSFSSGYTQTQSCDATRNRVAVDQTAPADTAMNLSGATGTTTGTIILSWSAGTDSGGSGVSDYRIAKLLGSKYPTSSGCTTSGSYISTGSSLTGYTYSGLSSGSIYTFRVCAVDAAGNVGSGSNSRSDVKAR
jgi:chitin-binding protein